MQLCLELGGFESVAEEKGASLGCVGVQVDEEGHARVHVLHHLLHITRGQLSRLRGLW